MKLFPLEIIILRGDKKPKEIVAYMCKGYQCSAPITSFDDLQEILS